MPRSAPAAFPPRLRRALQRLWPHTLSGRIAAILVAGMLAAQALTGTIWWDMRQDQLLQVPLRLVAARAADAVLLLSGLPADARPSAVHTLSSPTYRLRLRESVQPPPPARPAPTDPAAQQLLAEVVAHRMGRPVPLHLLELELRGDDGRDTSAHALLTARAPLARVHLLLGLDGTQWLEVEALEGEAGQPVDPLSALADYVLRIYLLRIVLVVVVALIAVRIAMRPLQRMARAADALGRDLQSPPLPVDGPREVRQAAQAFNAMQQRIAEGVAERTRFLAAVSHDLRSPITRLRLRTEMLQPEALRAKFRHDLAEMETLVASTLDVLTGANAQGQMQPIDINALVQGVVQDVQEAHGGAGIGVHGSTHAPLPGYARSLRRCLQNLLENAQRYGEAAQVRIEDTPRQLRITVRDSGPGIPPEALAHVLEPFYRVEHSRNAQLGGFGLGLSIADAVARAHGGQLQLHNRAEGGLDAVLSLPRTPAAAGASPPPAPSLFRD